MTERDCLQQLWLLQQDIAATPMLDRFAAEQRERWASRLSDLLQRRLATLKSPEVEVREYDPTQGSGPDLDD